MQTFHIKEDRLLALLQFRTEPTSPPSCRKRLRVPAVLPQVINLLGSSLALSGGQFLV